MKKLLLLLTATTTFGFASELELGMGVGTMYYPDYLGSQNTNTLVVPYPYITYTSEELTIDKDGLDKKLFGLGDLHLRLSGSGSLPVTSSGAREGMDDLDPALELGPALVYDVYKNDGFSVQLDAPIRAVVSTDWKGVDYRGYLYELRAEFEYDVDDYLFQLHTGGVWADEKYNNYLYGVEVKDVNDDRTYYEAKAGYSGYKTSFGVSKHFKKVWLGAFVRHYDLTNVAFEKSPLKEKNSAIYGGVFVAYLFDQSISRSIKNWIE